MASGSNGCAKREVHFTLLGLQNATDTVKYNAYCTVDEKSRRDTTSKGGCGKVKAVLTNTPSDTVSAYYDIWIQIYNPDFFTVYQSSVTEGQGTINWTTGNYALETMEEATNYVKSTEPSSEITGRSSDANLSLITY